MPVAPDALLAELEPTAARLLDRHLTTSKEWFPHQLVPWSRGRRGAPVQRGCQGVPAMASSP